MIRHGLIAAGCGIALWFSFQVGKAHGLRISPENVAFMRDLDREYEERRAREKAEYASSYESTCDKIRDLIIEDLETFDLPERYD